MNSNELYLRYIDDIFITISWPIQYLSKQIDRWNKFDRNIKLKAEVGHSINCLDVCIENKNGELFTKVYHKPAYEPYYLPFNSIHPMHTKKNIPFEILIIKYCSTFDAYLYEREKLRMALLLNRYPGEFIDKQFSRVFQKYYITQPLSTKNYNISREKIRCARIQEKILIDHEPNRIMRYMQDNAATIISSRGNQAYILATATIYDEWVRNNYYLQVWQNYSKMGTTDKHWTKEVIKRTKKRDDTINNRFVQKKINGLTTSIAQASATISNLQVQLTTYWTQTIGGGIVASTSATTNANRTRDPADRLEKIILKYIHYCTQHVKKMAEQKIQL
ncbi:unnamed protein product, partial [Rotaria sp. Silwood2]